VLDVYRYGLHVKLKISSNVNNPIAMLFPYSYLTARKHQECGDSFGETPLLQTSSVNMTFSRSRRCDQEATNPPGIERVKGLAWKVMFKDASLCRRSFFLPFNYALPALRNGSASVPIKKRESSSLVEVSAGPMLAVGPKAKEYRERESN